MFFWVTGKVAFVLCLFFRAYEVQEPSSTFYTSQNRPLLISRMDKIETDVREELKKQGFEGSRVHVERMLNMRFEGTDTSLMVLPDPNERLEADDGGDGGEDFLKAFRRVYKAEFGFLLEGKTIIVDDIKVGSNFPILTYLQQIYRSTGTRNWQDVRHSRRVCLQ